MKNWKLWLVSLVLAGLAVAIPQAQAQTAQRGEISGFVYDSSHAIVPKAKVTITNPATDYHQTILTDAAGTYAFPQLQPGVYNIHAEAEGFAATEITGINVQIGASLSLDISLPVKGQTQTVTVTAAAVGAVDTSTAGINQIINQRSLQNLPLSGRDYRDLAQLSSSAQVVPGLRGGIRLGGQQSDYAALVIDGQDSFNNFFGEFFGSLETKNFTVPLDSVQEFQVVTNGFAPEFGHATGGLINVVTKSGTNQVHGEAHEFYRGSGLTADDALGFPPNINSQNQFGGSVGFPIHKDRQFLFLATDVQRENGPLATNFCTSGSPSDCIGNFNLANYTGPTFEPCTGPEPIGNCPAGEVPLPGASTAGFSLPAGCKTPAAGETFLQTCFGVNSLADLQGSNNQFQDLFTLLGHYDYQLTPANHFSIRGYGTRNHTSGFTGGLGQNEVPAAFSETENFINQGISGTFDLATVLGRKVNEIRVSIEGETRKRHSNAPGTPTILVCDFANCSGNNDASASFLFGQRYYLPINGDNGKLEAADNFSYSFGKHDMKFGGDTDTFTDRKDTFVGWSSGQYEFSSLQAFQDGSSQDGSVDAFIQNLGLNGKPLFASGTLYNNYNSSLGLYWQDKWQITPRITFTYGLRWEGSWYPQPQTPFPGNETYTGTGANSHTIPVPQRVPNDYKQFGPRVGLAWNVGSAESPTVVRASWGLYYAQLPLLFLPTAGGGRTVGLFCFFNPTCLPTPGFPYLFPNSTTLGVNQLCSTADPSNGIVYGCPSPNLVDPEFQNPRISNLTAGVEHTFAHSWTVTATFAWVNSQHLRTGGYGSEEAWYRNFVPDGTDAFGRTLLAGFTNYVCANNTNPCTQNELNPFGAFTVTPLDSTLGLTTNTTASYAHGNYESAVLNVTKRFSQHFQMFANYIWSENKDNGASERDTDTYFGQQDPFNLNLDYGRNGLDIKHQFKASGVYQLPWGFLVSASVIAHTGVPYPLYVNIDINEDGVANSGYSHNNDRPTVQLSNGKVVLLDRYPVNQPGFAELDMRLTKDIKLGEKYMVELTGDFFNLTNRSNFYSNPDTNATINYAPNCVPNTPAPSATFVGAVAGPVGWSCTPLTTPIARNSAAYPGYGAVNQVAPGSTPFAFQAGAKFIF